MSKILTEIEKLRKQVRRMEVSDDHKYQGYEIYVVRVRDTKTTEFLGYRLYAIPGKDSYQNLVFQSGDKPLTDDEAYDKIDEFHIAIDYTNHVCDPFSDAERTLKRAVESYNKASEWIEEAKNDTSEDSMWTQVSITMQDAVRAAADAFGSKMDHYEFTRQAYWFIHHLSLSQIRNLTNYEVTVTKRNKQ